MVVMIDPESLIGKRIRFGPDLEGAPILTGVIVDYGRMKYWPKYSKDAILILLDKPWKPYEGKRLTVQSVLLDAKVRNRSILEDLQKFPGYPRLIISKKPLQKVPKGPRRYLEYAYEGVVYSIQGVERED